MQLSNFFSSLILLLAFTIIGNNASALDKNQVDSLYEVGNSLLATNRDSVLIVANKILVESERSNDAYGIAKAKLLASYYYINRLKLDTAESLLTQLKKTLDSTEEITNSDVSCEIWYYTGHLYMRKFNIRESILASDKSIEIAKSLGNNTMIGNTLFLRGDIEYLQQAYTKALEYYVEAYRAKKAAGDSPKNQVRLIERITECYDILGQPEKALQYSKDILQQTGLEDYQKGSILHNTGKFYMSLEKYDSAKLSLEAALKFSQTSEIGKENIPSIRFSNADNLSRMLQFDESNALLLSLTDDIQAHSGMAMDTYRILSRNYFGLSHYEKSIHYGRKAYDLIQSKGRNFSIISVSSILFQAYDQLGKTDSAYYFYKEHHNVKDSVYNLENQKKLSSLYAEIETQDKQAAIEKLELENQLANAETRNLTFRFWSAAILAVFIVAVLILLYRVRTKAHLLERYKLQGEIEKKLQDLNQQSVRLIQKNNSLTELEEGLKKMKKGMVNGKAQEVQQLLNTIRISKVMDKEWDKFDEYFGSANQTFLDRLGSRFPDLTVNEKRLSALIKMGFANREIAELMNIEDKSVRMAKYRLKKKMDLAEDKNLTEHLLEIEKGEMSS